MLVVIPVKMSAKHLLAFFLLKWLLPAYHCTSKAPVTIITKQPLLFKPESPVLIVNNSTKFSIPSDYKKEKRPTRLSSEPTVVLFDIHVVAINPIKAADMDFRMDMTLSQRWIDDRLSFGDEWFHDNGEFFVLPLEFTEQIWHPDPYIVNAKSTDVGQLTQKLVTVYIFKNKTVLYTANLFATVACAMNYRYYPFDHQVCPMHIESFSYNEAQVKYRWADGDSFTINPKLRMLQFEVTRPLHYHEASVPRYLEVKNFSQLIACFRFDRLLGNHLIQTFAPCSLIVCLSWFSFWLELNALSARMSLVVTSILTLVTQFVGLKADLPPVAYVKAVDVWMAGCMVWVFGALGEYVLVKVIFSATENAKFQYAEDIRNSRLKNQEVHKTADILSATQKSGNGIGTMETPQFSQIPPVNNGSRPRLNSRERRPSYSMSNDIFRSRSPSLSSIHLKKSVGNLCIPLQWIDPSTGISSVLWKKIDNVCKWLFPLSFCIFCGLYWFMLYIHSRATMVQPFSPLKDINITSCVQ